MRNNQPWMIKIVEADPEKCVSVFAEAVNHYSKRIHDAICPAYDIDNPLLVAMLESYAEFVREHDPDCSKCADSIKQLVESGGIAYLFRK